MSEKISEKEAVSLLNQAIALGQQAMELCVPKPMTVVNEDSNQKWFVPDGVCGFAWVTFRFGPFIRALRKAGLLGERGLISKNYSGGYMYWVSGGNQSMQKKEAFAQAMSSWLASNGVPASWASRMD